MRQLIVTENITIDGVIDAAGGWFAPGGDAEYLDNVKKYVVSSTLEDPNWLAC